MADVVAMDDVVHDPSAYARRAILEGLPPYAQSKYRSYGERKLEAEAVLRHLIERDKEMTQRLTVASHNLSASRQSQSEARGVAMLEAEHDQLSRRRSKVNEARVCYTNILHALDNWLTNRMTGVNAGPPYDPDVSPPVAVLGKNETFAAAIGRVQSEGSVLRMKLAQVKAAPWPPAEIRATLRAELERRHAEAQCGFRFERDARRLELFAPDVLPWGAALHPAGLGLGWALRMHGIDVVLAEFTAKLDDNAPGISRAEKPHLLAEIDAQIVELELAEISYVEQAQAEGLDVLPRASTHPLALLGLMPLRERPELMQAAE